MERQSNEGHKPDECDVWDEICQTAMNRLEGNGGYGPANVPVTGRTKVRMSKMATS